MKCPYRLMINAWSQLVLLFWEVVETSGDEAKRHVAIGHSFPFPSLLPVCHEANSFLYTISLEKLFTSPHTQSNGAVNRQNESFLPKVMSQQCKSNWYESYDVNFLKIVHMQKYGILYYNMNANLAIFSLSLLNVNIFKKQNKTLGPARLTQWLFTTWHKS